MLTQKKLAHLLNGASAAAGAADLLQAEIAALSAEMNGHRRELGEMPLRRAELILADDNRALINAQEAREQELYRELEKGDLQIEALQRKLAALRDAEIQPLIDRHRSILAEAQAKVEAAAIVAMEANSAAFVAFETAQRELGLDTATRLLPHPVHFVVLNSSFLKNWREHTDRENQRSARQQSWGHNIPQIQIVRSPKVSPSPSGSAIEGRQRYL